MSEEDNKKRSIEEDSFADALSNKRAALEGGVPAAAEDGEDLVFKMLCPTTIAGIIIGKAGVTINQINATCGAKVKLSGNAEFYPGTQDRIVIVTGKLAGILNAVRDVVTKIGEVPDRKPTNPEQPTLPAANKGPNGSIQMKILIPKLASGNMIGKGGSVVRTMSESSKCRINLSDNTDPYGTNERIIVITGPTAADVVLGAQTVMTQLLSQPLVRTYSTLQTSYPPAMGMPGGAPIGGPPPMTMPGMGGKGAPKSAMGMPGMSMQPTYGMMAPAGYGAPVGYAAQQMPGQFMPRGAPQQQAQQQRPQYAQAQPGYGAPVGTVYQNPNHVPAQAPAQQYGMPYQQQQPAYQQQQYRG
jgi:hypothetical protein